MKNFLGRVFFYLRPYKWRTSLLVVGMFVGVVYDTMMPFSFKFLIDNAIVPGNTRLLILILALLIGGGILTSLIGLCRDYLYARLSAAVLRDLRLRIFDHLQSLPFEFFDRTRPGDIAATFSTDLSSVEDSIVLALPAGIMALMGVLFSTILLFILEWKLALVAMMGLPVCLLGPRLIGKKAAEANDLYKREQVLVLDTVAENISAQSVIKAFDLRRLVTDRFQKQVSSLAQMAYRANFLSFVMERIPVITFLILHLTVICVCAVLAFGGYLSIGALVSFNAIFLSVSLSVRDLTSTLPRLMQAIAGMKRIESILADQAIVKDKPSAMAVSGITREIAFTDLSFGYIPERLVMDNVNVTIPAGSTVAFVGSSGSGKSTAVSLLIRLYDPCEGAITFDGIDVRDVARDSLLSRIGIVLQESFLFNASIEENVRLGRPDATRADIEAAAKAAGIHDVVLVMPDGYDTIVGERGSKLSGGERQRVAIARALIREPEILILDEATSALDPVTEALINDMLHPIGKDRTVITVTHRLSSTTQADRIYVFEGGRVVEQGRHEELIGQKGHYSSLWHKQSGFVLSGDGGVAEVRAERLRLIPVLSNLDERLLEEIAKLFVTERHPADRVVVHEGDPGDRFYIIVRGRAEVSKKCADGGEQIVNVLEDGDHFGEVALLKSIPRTATVTTVVSTTFLTLQRDLFFSLMNSAPDLRNTLAEQAARYGQ
jgi:ATP-binding cassette, subfamily B, bacterial